MKAEELITKLEQEIVDRYHELSTLRADAAPVPWNDYDFIGQDGQTRTLNELFGEHNQLILVHNMGRQCPWCTIWADGFSDSYHRLSKKTAFVVTSKETVDVQQKNIAERNWQFPMVSSKNNRILEDLGFLDADRIIPGLARFSRNDQGVIFYHGRHTFGPGDQFGMLWHVLDLTGKWNATDYAKPE